MTRKRCYVFALLMELLQAQQTQPWRSVNTGCKQVSRQEVWKMDSPAAGRKLGRTYEEAARVPVHGLNGCMKVRKLPPNLACRASMDSLLVVAWVPHDSVPLGTLGISGPGRACCMTGRPGSGRAGAAPRTRTYQLLTSSACTPYECQGLRTIWMLQLNMCAVQQGIGVTACLALGIAFLAAAPSHAHVAGT